MSVSVLPLEGSCVIVMARPIFLALTPVDVLSRTVGEDCTGGGYGVEQSVFDDERCDASVDTAVVDDLAPQDRRQAAAAMEVLPMVISLATLALIVAHEALVGCSECGYVGSLPLQHPPAQSTSSRPCGGSTESTQRRRTPSQRVAATARLVSTAHAHVTRNRWVELCEFVATTVQRVSR